MQTAPIASGSTSIARVAASPAAAKKIAASSIVATIVTA